MKFILNLRLYLQDEPQGETDILCEFKSPLDAIRAVAQLGTANSHLRDRSDVRQLFEHLPASSLARLRDRYHEGASIVVTEVREYRPEMPEEFRDNPELLFRVLASRKLKKIPPEGILETLHDEIIVH